VKAAKEGIKFGSRQGPQAPFYEFQLGSDHTVVGYSPANMVTSSVLGKASQPFVVWDEKNKKKLFLKDTWRVDLPNTKPEGEIYERLKQHQVPNIASAIWHGDVDGQQTLTSDLLTTFGSTNISNRFTRHKHYRLMLDKVGRPCTEYNNPFHFFTIVRQATKGECNPPFNTNAQANITYPSPLHCPHPCEGIAWRHQCV